VTAIAIPAAGTAAAHCRPSVTRLPDLGFGSEADAVRANTVVGWVGTNDSGALVPAIWRGGRLSLIGALHTHSGFAGDINARGEVVGTVNNAKKGFVYLHGTLHLLPPTDASFVYARRINDRGQIAGAAFAGRYAARWDSYASQPIRLLPAPGDAFSFAKGINDSATVAGESDSADGTPHPATWSADGAIHLLRSGFAPGQPGDLFAISNPGESVGESFRTDAHSNILADRATAWTPAGRVILIPLLADTNQSTALNLSDRGWVVGGAAHANYTTLKLGPTHALVWFGRGPAMTLPVPGLSYHASQSLAHGVDDQGTIVGSSGPAGGTQVATVWTFARRQAVVPLESPASDRSPTRPRTRRRPQPAESRLLFARRRELP
jgi:uncharacterized membrane protein